MNGWDWEQKKKQMKCPNGQSYEPDEIQTSSHGYQVRKGRNAELKKQPVGKVESLNPSGKVNNVLDKANVGLNEAKLIVAVIL